ncbi:MAG: hypothetical protein ACYDCH_05960 [Gaiellaceae bacterium]
MWETADPDGRRVVLDAVGWAHIVGRHDVLEPHLERLLRAVSQPERRLPGRRDDEEYFYLAWAGPSRWLKVVVHYEHDRGRIVTAFPRRRFP